MPCRSQITDKAYLRLLEEADARALYGLIEANRALLAEWMPWAAGQTIDDTLDFIRRARAQLSENDGFQTAVVVEGSIAGVIGYHAVDWANRSTSIGYWLGAAHQGQGTMTAAVCLLADQALSTWRLKRVEIRVAAENRRSRAIPERLGFRQEKTLFEAERVGDRSLDTVVYSLLASDPRSSRLVSRGGPSAG